MKSELIPGLLLGQWIKREETKPKPTTESTVTAAITSGKGLRAAARMVEAGGINLTDQHLQCLIDLLKEEIESRQQMLAALEARKDQK